VLDLCPNTTPGSSVDADGCAIIEAQTEVSSANGFLVAGIDTPFPGFTLYVFDNDLGSTGSVCTGICSANISRPA